ncbi:MAG TPA: DUF1294 domain-containing protein [Planctomycetota bacterium]|nr:DUF1294 domain-containing protein [Planctomycetota bacterium]HPY75675.1 DUF1294 domain-containing protein [Planctomycetota bacterium]HQB01224.1 DUF1294 domain-containing protein [Planctomycetota bacterium]
MEGIVTKFNSKKGYGFIRYQDTKDGSQDIFVHINDVQDKVILSPRQEVIFDMIETPRGLNAVNVVPGEIHSNPYHWFLSFGLLTMFFLIWFFGSVWKIPWIWSYFISVNIVITLMYGYDKYVAVKHRTRIPEIVLHFFTLIGGTPMAWISQRLFRHKITKKTFQMAFWVVFFIQMILIYNFIHYLQ